VPAMRARPIATPACRSASITGSTETQSAAYATCPAACKLQQHNCCRFAAAVQQSCTLVVCAPHACVVPLCYVLT
jgi:hypothetical protein